MNDVVKITIRKNKAALAGEPVDYVSLYDIWKECDYNVPYHRWAKNILIKYNIKAVPQVIKTKRRGRNVTGYYVPLESTPPIVNLVKVRRHIQLVFLEEKYESSDIEIYEHEGYGKAGAVILEGKIWFVASSILKIMGYDKEKIMLVSDRFQKSVSGELIGLEGAKKVKLLSEEGLYDIIFHGRGERSLSIQSWFIRIVLPDLRSKII